MNIQLPTFASNFLGARSRRSGVVLAQPPEVPAAQPRGGGASSIALTRVILNG